MATAMGARAQTGKVLFRIQRPPKEGTVISMLTGRPHPEVRSSRNRMNEGQWRQVPLRMQLFGV